MKDKNLMIAAGMGIELCHLHRDWYVGRKGVKDLVQTCPKPLTHSLKAKDYRTWMDRLKKKGWDFDREKQCLKQIQKAHNTCRLHYL